MVAGGDWRGHGRPPVTKTGRTHHQTHQHNHQHQHQKPHQQTDKSICQHRQNGQTQLFSGGGSPGRGRRLRGRGTFRVGVFFPGMEAGPPIAKRGTTGEERGGQEGRSGGGGPCPIRPSYVCASPSMRLGATLKRPLGSAGVNIRRFIGHGEGGRLIRQLSTNALFL